MSIVIAVEHLSKSYRLGQIGTGTFTDDLKVWWAKMRGRSNPLLKIGEKDHGNHDGEELWALRDVSFTVEQGEVLGIIGRNGAGKSTLLKILSRVTAPTSGKIKVKGRIASLLEVGTGFHPELTGRENIYLNGAILGMTKQEVTRKFDEIVDFSGVEKFIDTPVKRYSSGMYVRLAFAVAAHLEPEILVVDEVLAVGDAEFQKKCLGKMRDVANEGRTVLFVSHNMAAITQLCSSSVCLSNGIISDFGISSDVIERYLSGPKNLFTDVHLDPSLKKSSPVVFLRCWLGDEYGTPLSSVNVMKPFSVGLEILCRRQISDVDVGIRLLNGLGAPLFSSTLSDKTELNTSFAEGVYAFLVDFPPNYLAPDRYSLTIGIHCPGREVYDIQENVLSFQVDEIGTKRWRYRAKEHGNILTNFSWRPFLRDVAE
ncbi:MAG: ABC transporter ATP-binding protein [Chloroflexi bacterium HGW-Chloroflexi-6]|nr:MAG: ABC transporter ATP-binding protein [Chloroflexi bacterium HGW-Chloroflexi-6]